MLPADLFARLRYRHPFRPYQQRVLDMVAAEQAQGGDGGGRWHIVAPPGSGKTVLGLELVRFLGHPAVVFAPNAAIQRQWAERTRDFLPPDDALDPDAVVVEGWRAPPPPLLSLTYQSVTVAARETELLDALARALWVAEVGDPSRLDALRAANPTAFREELERFRTRVRRRLLDEPDFDPTTLLHPSAQVLVDGLVARGTRTVVLDECHHLTGTWAILLGALVRRLDRPWIIGLTATPPVDRTDREQVRYLDLVGEIRFQVPTPAVVRDGNLAPFQDLAFFTVPTPSEMRFVAGQHAHWKRVQSQLNEGGRLDGWIRARITAPRRADGEPIPWEAFVKGGRTLAVAGVRWFGQQGWELPEHVTLTREMLDPPTPEDRLRLLADFALNGLKLSPDPNDHALLDGLRVAGRALGFHLTESGFRRATAPVDRLLALSRAKQAAALIILRHEWAAIGKGLRAVVICDFERSSATLLRQLEGALDPDAESALGTMRELAQSDLDTALRPVLVTGKTLLCDDKNLTAFMEAARTWFAARELDVTMEEEAAEGAGFHRIHGSGRDWRTGTYVAMVTALLEQGVTRCLVGTRALLGEGWDSLALNTFIDLTYATTFTSVNQLRGRAIRLDPRWPDKVANNWDVVCLAPGFEKGLHDWERFLRKHETFFGIADDGVIEVGVGHVHPLLAGVSGEELGALRTHLNTQMLARAADREGVRRLWGVGEPYENVETHALELRVPAGVGLRRSGSARRAEALRVVAALAALGPVAVVAVALTPLLAFALGGAAQAALETWLSGGIGLGSVRLGLALTWLLLSATLLTRTGLLLLRRGAAGFITADNEGTLQAMARATLEAMQATELLPSALTPEAIHLSTREDGFLRVWLEGDDPDAVERFARAMGELLGPVTDEFRYTIPRYEVVLPGHALHRAWRLLLWATNRWAGDIAAWHPVPHELGAKGAHVRAFEDAWQRHVSPGAALFLRRADAAPRLRTARRLPPRVERRVKRIWR